MNKTNNVEMTVEQCRQKIEKWKGLPVAPQTVRSLIRRGDIAFSKRGGSIRIHPEALEEYFRKHSK